MKKQLLHERFQELAGIKPLYELNEQLGLGDHGGGHPHGGTKSDPSQLIDQTKVKIDILGDEKEVIIDRKGEGLSDVTISWDEPWGREKHNVEFEEEDKIDDHGNEGIDLLFTAESEDGMWKFGLEVYAEATYPMTGDIADWDWGTLEIDHIKN